MEMRTHPSRSLLKFNKTAKTRPIVSKSLRKKLPGLPHEDLALFDLPHVHLFTGMIEPQPLRTTKDWLQRLSPWTQGEYDGLFCAHFEDDRPLQGLLGFVDFLHAGEISRFLRRGQITGKHGEFTLVSLSRPQPRRLVLLGLGPRSQTNYQFSEYQLKCIDKFSLPGNWVTIKDDLANLEKNHRAILKAKKISEIG